ncbi:MAG: hypothetical protein AAF607_02080 [Pseudomonadota bacterium]
MEPAEQFDAASADSAHLPTVSVFIVLLAILAALTASTTPSTANFKAAKLSILDSFARGGSNDETKRLALPAALNTALASLCSDFKAACKPVVTENADALAVLFDQPQFAATSGLTSAENKFLRALARATKAHSAPVTVVVPPDVRLDAPEIAVVRALVQRFSDDSVAVSVAQIPSLPGINSLGFMVLPRGARL